MNIHPIRTEADYRAALAQVDALWSAPDGSPEADRLEIITLLIERWERDHHPILPPDPIEALRFRMEQGGLTLRDVQRLLRIPASQVTALLEGQRSLTLHMIRTLHHHLDIPAESLLAPPH